MAHSLRTVFSAPCPHAHQPDCSDALVQGAPWDPYRTQIDQTGYVNKLLGMMPLQQLRVGDGLNMAGFRWVETSRHDNRYELSTPQCGNRPTSRSITTSTCGTRSTSARL